jgi:hypothetical protein
MALPTSGTARTPGNRSKVTEGLFNAVLAVVDESNGHLTTIEALKLIQGIVGDVIARVEASHE